ncbi:hypothetical protein JL722_8748 [Aureococcus anophagefferens]|nr:hypothetical protein JL722_8748 [Aureococcus anophagefferens]
MQPPQLALVAGALAATVAVAASLYARSRKRRDDDEEEDGGVARHVYRIVLTGGPCAGKTTALARLSGYLQERGFRVYMIPEMATVMFTNGVAFSDLSSDAAVRTMQRAILDGQLTLEDGFARIAAETRAPAVLLCDRGAMDGSAYMRRELWRDLLRGYFPRGASLERAERTLCERYDAVFHLVTAADSAERFYTLENNAARTESPEDARAQDSATQRAWAMHPKQMVFDNSSGELGFEGKLERVVDAAAKIVGLPVLPKSVRKFVFLQQTPRKPRTSHLSHALPEEESSYDCHAYVRVRTSVEGAASYGYVEVLREEAGDGQIHERKRRILRREYEAHLATADPRRKPIAQRRLHFLYGNQSLVVHQYVDRDLAILHCQAARPDGSIDFPPFLKVGPEIHDSQDREHFSAYDLALDKPSSPSRGTYRKSLSPPSSPTTSPTAKKTPAA